MTNIQIFDQICPIKGTDLFITCYDTAADVKALVEHAIDVVINVSSVDHSRETKTQFTAAIIHYHFVPIKFDMSHQPILDQCDQVVKIIKEYPDRNILIHCHAGISRSTSVAIYYVMSKAHESSFEQCLALIEETRPMVCPNQGFQEQIENYYKIERLLASFG